MTLSNLTPGQLLATKASVQDFLLSQSPPHMIDVYIFTALVDKATLQDQQGGLLYISLDHFDLFHEAIGKEQLNAALTTIGYKLLKEGALVHKPQEQTYVALIQNMAPHKVKEKAAIISQFISQEMEKHTACKMGGCSIGIRYLGVDSEQHQSAAAYISQAENACTVARLDIRDQIIVFDSNRNKHALAMVKALKDQRVGYAFQPIVRVSDGQPMHYETLIRLKTEGGKVVAPDTYLPYIESTSIMLAVDKYSLDYAIERILDHPCQEHSHRLILAINVSSRSLHGAAWVDYLHKRISETNIHPDQLVIEITETWSQVGAAGLATIAQEIVDAGCSVAIDDFGAGNHSYTDLLSIPAQYIKIDSSLISQITNSKIHRNIVEHLAYTANQLGMTPIAEAVSSKELMEAVIDIGIPMAQGYYIGRPMDRFSNPSNSFENVPSLQV